MDLKNSLQKLMLSDNPNEDVRQLYYRGAYRQEGDALIILPGECVNFNTYFNAFSAVKWRRYTKVKKVGLALSFVGTIEVALYHNVLTKGVVRSTCLKKETLISDTSSETGLAEPVFLSNFREGNLSFTIRALKETRFLDGNYYAADAGAPKEVHLAAVITTFRREDELKANLVRAKSLDPSLFHAYIVDNAGDLELPASDLYTRIANRNLGGAGGFTRGMLAVMEEKAGRGFTHCVLMDDDIILDPRVIERLVGFLSYTTKAAENLFISGAMLRRDKPYIHMESGALRDRTIVRGYGRGLDMRLAGNVLQNDALTEPDYGGWWFYCIPIAYLREDNLALPLFFQWDDVDYGVRNKAPILTMNGIGVWHDALEGKRSLSYTYYATRNPLIVDACHGRPSKNKAIANLDRFVINNILMYRYDYAKMVIRAAKDFMKGPDWLLSLDEEAFHKKVMAQNKPYRPMRHIRTETMEVCAGRQDKNRLGKLLRFATLNGWLLPADHSVILPAETASIVTAYRAKKIVYYDARTQTGYRCKKSYRQALRVLIKYLPVRLSLIFCYNKLRDAYQAGYAYMTSKEYWQKKI